MMPHEYEKEIRALKDKIGSLEFRLGSQREFIDELGEKIKTLEARHGQAYKESAKGLEERPKGHKKVAKDGQEGG